MSAIPWKYPIGYFCKKCNNTGYKIKNGKSCKDCWKRFARQPNVIQQVQGPPVEKDGFRIPFTTMKINDDFTISDTYNERPVYYQANPIYPANYTAPVPIPAPAQPPSDPPPYDFHNQGPTQSYNYHKPPPPQIQQTYAPQIQRPMVPAQRVVMPGDPSLGGILCGRCRGYGTTYSFWRDEESICPTCQGVGRIL